MCQPLFLGAFLVCRNITVAVMHFPLVAPFCRFGRRSRLHAGDSAETRETDGYDKSLRIFIFLFFLVFVALHQCCAA
jgi:hypothetical protein